MFKALKKQAYNEFVGTWKGFKKEKISPKLFLVILANVICLLISNIIAVKTLDLGLKFGSGSSFIEFTIPAAVVMYVFNVTFSDILCEIYPVWSRRSCHLSFILNLFMVMVFTITIYLPGVINGQPAVGMDSNIGAVLGSSWFMLLASIISYYFGDLLNDTVFAKLRAKDDTSKKSIIKRCIVSTGCGQLIDSTIFISLGLFLFPKWFTGTPFIGYDWSTMSYGLWGGWASVLGTILVQFIVKVVVELLLSPVILYVCKHRKGIAEETQE